VTQAFTLTVDQAPAFTSATSDTVTAGTAFSFTVQASGYPVATLLELGFLPAGVTLVNNGNGTATISGTPTGTRAQTSTLLILAISGTGLVAQVFTLTVDPPG
jgi:hypothetical protein